MMMMPKKPSATLIVSKMMGKGDEAKDPRDMYSLKDAISRGDEDQEGGDDEMMLESIMEEFIKAVEKKDAKEAAEVLKSFIMVCDPDDYKEDEEEPAEDEGR